MPMVAVDARYIVFDAVPFPAQMPGQQVFAPRVCIARAKRLFRPDQRIAEGSRRQIGKRELIAH